MPITVVCSACAKQSHAPEEAVGRTLACPHCGSPVPIAACQQIIRRPNQDPPTPPPRRQVVGTARNGPATAQCESDDPTYHAFRRNAVDLLRQIRQRHESANRDDVAHLRTQLQLLLNVAKACVPPKQLFDIVGLDKSNAKVLQQINESARAVYAATSADLQVPAWPSPESVFRQSADRMKQLAALFNCLGSDPRSPATVQIVRSLHFADAESRVRGENPFATAPHTPAQTGGNPFAEGAIPVPRSASGWGQRLVTSSEDERPLWDGVVKYFGQTRPGACLFSGEAEPGDIRLAISLINWEYSYRRPNDGCEDYIECTIQIRLDIPGLPVFTKQMSYSKKYASMIGQHVSASQVGADIAAHIDSSINEVAETAGPKPGVLLQCPNCLHPHLTDADLNADLHLVPSEFDDVFDQLEADLLARRHAEQSCCCLCCERHAITGYTIATWFEKLQVARNAGMSWESILFGIAPLVLGILCLIGGGEAVLLGIFLTIIGVAMIVIPLAILPNLKEQAKEHDAIRAAQQLQMRKPAQIEVNWQLIGKEKEHRERASRRVGQ